MIKNFEELITAARQIQGKKVIVILPNNEETLLAISEACEKQLAEFILVGDQDTIKLKLPIYEKVRGLIEIVHKPDVSEALKTAIDLIKGGKGDIVLKGGVDTSTLMKALLHEDAGIRTGRLLSDVFMFEYPARQGNKFVMITDGGITLAPDLEDKIELVKNAVEVAHALGNSNPKVALLSASEFINPNLQSTVDAAIISKMNERGQIKGCTVDGPLALDNALSSEAAGEKKIVSQVAGNAEILVLPSIEAANIFAKGTTYFAGYRLAHVIVGGSVPILIPSRADKSDAKVLSIALGKIMSNYYPKNKDIFH
ncbi:MAG: bifunctional enoyl-CoA hydratase/phosphate acetyltransferase [Ignavibacteriales bacterium]|nr:bifunctional enoyl-CoA hydratase/phosphate acetyltransferase [Ignavibacteriales bacterium]